METSLAGRAAEDRCVFKRHTHRVHLRNASVDGQVMDASWTRSEREVDTSWTGLVDTSRRDLNRQGGQVWWTRIMAEVER